MQFVRTLLSLILFLSLQPFAQEIDKREPFFNILTTEYSGESIIPKKLNTKSERTLIKKVFLTGGFLQVQKIRQDWNGFNWVNSNKCSYTYDGNNNEIEVQEQCCDGSGWANTWKHIYSFDGNNNFNEEFEQEQVEQN